ncbi:MAG: Calvin cycle protein CP12 [Fischerella sp. CENA71]|nr:Calvin cycle protein CP12 [Fischerella sp. CENA71]
MTSQTLDVFQALDEARTICVQKGSNSNECILAWETVEKLRVEQSQQQQITKRKTDLERYCEIHPEAIECRIYDV